MLFSNLMMTNKPLNLSKHLSEDCSPTLDYRVNGKLNKYATDLPDKYGDFSDYNWSFCEFLSASELPLDTNIKDLQDNFYGCVPDARVTREHWLLNDTLFYYIGIYDPTVNRSCIYLSESGNELISKLRPSLWSKITHLF